MTIVRGHCKSTSKKSSSKIMQKYSSVITIGRFLVQNIANYRTMAEISTAKNSLLKSPTELEKDGPSFSSLFSLASACATGDIAPLSIRSDSLLWDGVKLDLMKTCKTSWKIQEGHKEQASLQSNQVKRTPPESINEFIIWKLTPSVVVDFRLISTFLHA